MGLLVLGAVLPCLKIIIARASMRQLQARRRCYSRRQPGKVSAHFLGGGDGSEQVMNKSLNMDEGAVSAGRRGVSFLSGCACLAGCGCWQGSQQCAPTRPALPGVRPPTGLQAALKATSLPTAC